MVYSQPFQSISPVQVQIIVRVAAFLPRFAVIDDLLYPISYSSRIPQYSLKLSEQSESLDLFIQFKERLRKWKLFFCHFKGEKYLYLLFLKYTLFTLVADISKGRGSGTLKFSYELAVFQILKLSQGIVFSWEICQEQ